MSAETRRRIMDGASQLFAEQGYAKTSLKGIEERAGISRGSILHHFGSKEGLLVAVVEQNFQEWVTNVVDSMGDSSGRNGLQIVHETHKDFVAGNADANQRYYVLAFEALAGNDDLVQRYRTLQVKLVELSRRIITDGIEAGEMRADIDVDNLARILHAVYVGMGVQMLFDTSADVTALYAELWRTLDAALRPVNRPLPAS